MMSPLHPVKRRDLVRRLRKLGFEGPHSGGRHQFMVRGDVVLHIPNPHQHDIGRNLLSRILRQAGIQPDEWAGSAR
ncbi:MAG: type II toxin-antitoxin system HicA family toxin [Deltaproteobacteria bacterium]|nr:type II toxin-antitoxin system HicA family toxin [Deltaproteobacteria bacterium]